MNLLKDYLASRVIVDGKILDDYTKIYFKTNENLNDFDIDFTGKDVFSVLGSSDQVFISRGLGAKKVDSFDKNPLVIYYYYLRCWTIEYTDMFYPYPLLDNDYKWLYQLLKKVEVNSDDEKKAFIFWERHLKNKTNLYKLFFEDTREGKLPLSIMNEDLIGNHTMNFQTINLFEKNDFNQSYDIVLLSNIIEWARGSKSKIICIRDNLNQLLRENGIVLCTGLINRYVEKINEERKIFDTNFDYIECGRSEYAYRKR